MVELESNQHMARGCRGPAKRRRAICDTIWVLDSLPQTVRGIVYYWRSFHWSAGMAAVNISSISLLTPLDFYTVKVITDHPKPITFRPRRKPSSVCLATSSPEPSAALEKAVIELEFIGPEEGADGKYPVEKATSISGEKLLRNIMLDNKIELYATYGKVMNCGGGGSCGTCIVEIIDGTDLLNERTNTELRYLKKKPESWRLACQTIVGNKENSGKVLVQRLPQWKK